MRSPTGFPALMGAFGVILGLATFVLLRDELGKNPSVFVLGVLAAVVTSFAIEAVRARAEQQTSDPPEKGRVLGLLILLVVFEVFASGAERLGQILAAGEGPKIIDALFVKGITDRPFVLLQFVIFTGLWALLGAAAAWGVARHAPEPGPPRAVAVPALRAMGIGLLTIAATALTYVFFARLMLTVYVLLVDPASYQPGFLSLVPTETPTAGHLFTSLAIALAAAVEALARLGRFGGVAVLIAVGVMVEGLRRSFASDGHRSTGATLLQLIVVLALALLALGPFATNPEQLSQLLNAVAAITLVWLPPIAVLTVAWPLLAARARDPRVWGIIAFATAAVLVAVTAGRLAEDAWTAGVVAITVIGLLGIGVLLRRGADVARFWPLVALVVSIATFEGSSLLLNVTFVTSFKQVALLQSAPLTDGGAPQWTEARQVVREWAGEGDVPAAVAADVETLSALSIDDVAELEALAERLAKTRDETYAAAVDALCARSGSALLDAWFSPIEPLCEQARRPLSEADAAAFAARAADLEPAVTYPDLLVQASTGALLDMQEFRWSVPTSPAAQRMLRDAQSALGDTRPATAAQVLRGEAASVEPDTRVWLVLEEIARTPLPLERVEGWLGRSYAVSMQLGRTEGMPITLVALWWSERLRNLRDLVAQRHAPEPPARVHVGASIRGVPSSPDPQRARRRTVHALAYAAQRAQTRLEIAYQARAFEPQEGIVGLLELTLAASFAFWATAGLLADASVHRRSAPQQP